MLLKNSLVLDAAQGKLPPRSPVWLMRQAGRVLPEYRALRDTFKDFKKYIKTPEAVAQATLQPVDILGVDAAIIFSDILVIPEALGLDYEMVESKGPKFPKIIQSANDIQQLKIPDVLNDLNYVFEAIKITKKELNNRVPLIGFAGAPWTIFAYMTEGSGSKTFSKARRFLYQQPQAAHLLLQKITDVTIDYLKQQIEAGADLIQIFDSWAGILTPEQYKTYSFAYIKQICDSITHVPKIVFAKDAYFARPLWNRVNCQVVGLDWCMDIAESKQMMPEKTLQGNLDPCVLYADKATIVSETKKMLQAFGKTPHIANLGHGLYPDIPADNVRIFIDTVKNNLS